MSLACIIVINLYSSRCFDQETEKDSIALRVKLPFAHMSTTRCEHFLFNPTGNRIRVYPAQ